MACMPALLHLGNQCLELPHFLYLLRRNYRSFFYECNPLAPICLTLIFAPVMHLSQLLFILVFYRLPEDVTTLTLRWLTLNGHAYAIF